ncbi:HSP20 family protein [Catenulispora sp. GP43]|uniref:Hsp20/alpha crystallin family protein n=1 Tax=Catenulispora sp. GP43 TaxID=3156263 RepID=UPI0035115F60
MNDSSSPGGGEDRSRPHWGLPGWHPSDLDSLLDRLGTWAGRATGGWIGGSRWTPAVEEDETAEAYRIRLELPGIPRDRIAIDVEGHQLSVHGDLVRGEAGQDTYLAHRAGQFGYRTSLPADADPEAVRADLSAGILTVTVPRGGRGPRRTIRIDDTE